MNLVYWKGRLWPPEKVSISPLNTGFFFGENLFETIPVYRGNPLFLGEHLKRLEQGCRFLKWPFLSKREVERAVRLFSGNAEGRGCFMLRLNVVQELKGPVSPRNHPRHPPAFFATT